MNSTFEKLSMRLLDMAMNRVDVGLFKSKLNKEVLFYDSSNHGYVFHRIVWIWSNYHLDYIKAMLDILTSQGEIMHLFSLKMAEVGGRTPLEIAIIRVNIPTVKLLLEYGAIHYIKKFDALYYSAVNGIKEMMMLLLRHGAMFHVRTIKIHSDLNDRFPIVNIIKNIDFWFKLVAIPVDIMIEFKQNPRKEFKNYKKKFKKNRIVLMNFGENGLD